jgi:hypothetical protein
MGEGGEEGGGGSREEGARWEVNWTRMKAFVKGEGGGELLIE